MFGKIIGAFAGSQIAKRTRQIDSPMGAVVGVIAASVIRRLSIPALAGLTAGGYFAKRYFDGRKAKAKLQAKRSQVL